MGGLAKDLRYALRTLVRSPLFTLAAVLCLALGIGFVSAVWSVVQAVLLRQLPYRDPSRIVVVWGEFAHRDETFQAASGAEVLDYESVVGSFSQVAALFPKKLFTLSESEGPEQLYGARVSASLFPLLGAEAELGRTFLPQEDRFGNRFYVLLSHRLWQQRFGGDPGIIGRPIQLDGNPYTVVGVMPPSFRFWSPDYDLWVPLAMNVENLPPRTARGLVVVARLADGVSLRQARQELDAFAAHMSEEHADAYPADSGWRIQLVPLLDQVVGDVRSGLWLLLGAVAVVLVIACANVANLSLARATTRDREVAVRAALGGGRGSLLRQFLTESVVLAAAGGAVGLLFAWIGVRTMSAFSGAGHIPRFDEVGIDGSVAAFTLLLALATGVLFGLVPALQLLRHDLSSSLREGGKSSAGSGRHLARSSLVVAEVALALVVLAAAGLLVQSYRKLRQVEPGYRPAGVVASEIFLPPPKFGRNARSVPFFDAVLERLRAIPGVRAVAVASGVPMGNFQLSGDVTAEDHPPGPGEATPQASLRIVSSGYFEALGVPLLLGRDFDDRDDQGAPAVAVVDQRLAEHLWPGEKNVLGKRLLLDKRDPAKSARTVVGVVGHALDEGLEGEGPDLVYVPYHQYPFLFMYLVLATDDQGTPTRLAAAVRSSVREVDRDQPIFDTYTLEELLDHQVAWRRFYTVLLTVFAGVALLLAMVGVYGVMAYSVAQRTREIGVRLALGAQRRDVLSMVVRQGLALAGSGVLVGLLLTFWAARVGRGYLYGVSTVDPWTYAAVVGLLVALALLGSYLPARRATRVDPLVAFRAE